MLEALADPAGCLVPSTPVVAVAVDPTDRDAAAHVAALLIGPPASAWVFCQAVGTGLSAGALRVPARTVLQIPLPANLDRWSAGAKHADAAAMAAARGDAEGWRLSLDALAREMAAAYGLDEEHPVVAWWEARRPAWR